MYGIIITQYTEGHYKTEIHKIDASKTDVTPAILSRDFVAQLYRATKWYVWHAVLHIATLSPKQELKLVNLAVGLQYRVWTCL